MQKRKKGRERGRDKGKRGRERSQDLSTYTFRFANVPRYQSTLSDPIMIVKKAYMLLDWKYRRLGRYNRESDERMRVRGDKKERNKHHLGNDVL